MLLNPKGSWTFYRHIFVFMPISVSHVESAIFELNCGEICQKTRFFSIVPMVQFLYHPPLRLREVTFFQFFSHRKQGVIRNSAKTEKNF